MIFHAYSEVYSIDDKAVVESSEAVLVNWFHGWYEAVVFDQVALYLSYLKYSLLLFLQCLDNPIVVVT